MSETKKNTLSTEPYKGVRDFYPEDMAVQNYIFSVWRKVAEQFGYQEYNASILEPAELYRQKSGDEIVNEQMYVFTDKGDREVTLRPEMTPSLARMVAARRKSLKFPLRWYSIANMFRYERPQRGRKREHWQLNCDLLGVAGPEGDAEIIKLAYDVMKAFGAKNEDFKILANHVGTINFHSIHSGVSEEFGKKYFKLLDKKPRSPEGLREWEEKRNLLFGGSEQKAKEFEARLWEVAEKIKKSQLNEPHHAEMQKIVDRLSSAGITNVEPEPTLTRGFDYYTGMIFEVYDTNPKNRRSLFGGGRFDNLLDIFGVEPVPAVGFGMGDVTIRDFLETHKLPTTRM